MTFYDMFVAFFENYLLILPKSLSFQVSISVALKLHIFILTKRRLR